MLTPRVRLERALHGKTVDRPPCICPGGMMNMIVEEAMDATGCAWPAAHSDAETMAGLSAGIYELGGFENFGVPFCMTVEAEAMGAKVSMGSRNNEPRVTAYPIESVADWQKLLAVDPEQGRAKVVVNAIKRLTCNNPGVPVIANLTGPVSLAASLMEPMTFYKELHKKPDQAHRLMEVVTDNLIAFGRAQLMAGADVLSIADPSGTGEILGPRMFGRFALPYLNRIVASLSDEAPIGTIVHICGRLRGIYGELNQLKSDAVSFDSITGVRQMALNVKDKVLMGNVSTFVLENSSPEKIKAISRLCVKHGVKILSPACGIGSRTKLTNIRAMVQAAKECGEK